MPKLKRKTSNLVVEFDAKARREHLTGFSERKRARRIHGLAQQKRKEHRARREQRAERKQADEEALVEAEQKKPIQQKGSAEEKIEEHIVYQDTQTQDQWGGEVFVTATTVIPGAAKEPPKRKQKSDQKEDVAQEYAGSLEKFVNQVKGNLPGKKKKKHKKAVVKTGDAKIVAKSILKSRKSSKKR